MSGEEEIAEMVAGLGPRKDSYAVLWDAHFLWWVAASAPGIIRDRGIVAGIAVRVFTIVELLFGLFAVEEVAYFGGVIAQLEEEELRELVNGHEGDLELLRERTTVLLQSTVDSG
jgi:hypothetical protein